MGKIIFQPTAREKMRPSKMPALDERIIIIIVRSGYLGTTLTVWGFRTVSFMEINGKKTMVRENGGEKTLEKPLC